MTIGVAAAILMLGTGCDSTSAGGVGGAMTGGNADIHEAREELREHWATLTSIDRDPLAGTTWGPGFDDYAAMLRQKAVDGGLGLIPELPWSSEQLARIDELARDVGLIDGPPLLP